MVLLGNKEYYKGIGEIKFEGKESDNPLAFKYYNQTCIAYIVLYIRFNDICILYLLASSL